ncbi:hypothetical protein [Saccharopolyspora sp. 5N708]|uniref:hypothetical protein n=1 Tax=Saccharopolyspora sp. 5N708 TaxID=3457424 RepID=UPI003FD0DF1C
MIMPVIADQVLAAINRIFDVGGASIVGRERGRAHGASAGPLRRSSVVLVETDQVNAILKQTLG